MEDRGSYGGGFALGFFLGLIGLIIALCLNKPQTKKGAVTGFLVSLAIGVVVTVCYYVSIAGTLS